MQSLILAVFQLLNCNAGQQDIYVYSPRRQRQGKEMEQIDRGQNLQFNRDIQLTSMIKAQTSKNIETIRLYDRKLASTVLSG